MNKYTDEEIKNLLVCFERKLRGQAIESKCKAIREYSNESEPLDISGIKVFENPLRIYSKADRRADR